MAKEQEKKIGQVDTVEVVEARPQGLSVMAKAEVESLVDVANRHPRNIMDFRDKCQSLATFDEEIAASCFYALPRAGTVIEGPSIRLAEIALSCYGNCVAEADVLNEDGKFIYAMHKNIKTIKPYLDTLNVTRNEIIETLVEKDKDGKPILKEDEEGKPKLSYKGKNEEKAKSKFEEVLKTENEIHFHLINLKDWESVNGLNLNKITGLALFMDRMLTE